jgi:hypothetical protein
LRLVAKGAGADPDALARGFLGLREVFGDDLPRSERFVAEVAAALRGLEHGARITAQRYVAGAG